MNNRSGGSDIELIRVIVNYGLGSKIIKAAKKYGISGGTVTLGKGTIKNRLLNYIGITDEKKEIVHMATEKETAERVLEKLNQEFEFYKPHHGIAFTTSICGIFGTQRMLCKSLQEESEADNSMYHIITVIVDRGKAEEVIAAATKAVPRAERSLMLEDQEFMKLANCLQWTLNRRKKLSLSCQNSKKLKPSLPWSEKT
jgi:hypothetical protein